MLGTMRPDDGWPVSVRALCWYQVICVESESGGPELGSIPTSETEPESLAATGSGARVGAEVSYQALIQSSNHHPQCER